MMREKSLEDVALFASMVAKKQGWALNPDQGFLSDLLEGLRVNYSRHGYFLCPCRDGDGSREADSDIICPCAYARPDIEEWGHCFCSLYMSPAFASSGARPSSVPERRVSRP
jgi:ferredoxin-thioredoxin reductase catalytic subunit